MRVAHIRIYAYVLVPAHPRNSVAGSGHIIQCVLVVGLDLASEQARVIREAIKMTSERILPTSVLAAIAALLLLPTRSSAEELSGYSGAQLFQRFCASCHGVHGLGDGPVAPALNVLVPDLTRIKRRHGGEFPADLVRRIVDGRAVQVPHGTREMPVWGSEFRIAGEGAADAGSKADDLVGRLVDYLRSMQKE
jgi:mono/diheme cytochrome c family protein